MSLLHHPSDRSIQGVGTTGISGIITPGGSDSSECDTDVDSDSITKPLNELSLELKALEASIKVAVLDLGANPDPASSATIKNIITLGQLLQQRAILHGAWKEVMRSKLDSSVVPAVPVGHGGLGEQHEAVQIESNNANDITPPPSQTVLVTRPRKYGNRFEVDISTPYRGSRQDALDEEILLAEIRARTKPKKSHLVKNRYAAGYSPFHCPVKPEEGAGIQEVSMGEG